MEGLLNTYRKDLAGAEDWARAFFEKCGVPAMSFAVARPSGLAWAMAFGNSNLEYDVLAESASLFRLGSVSKVISSTLAARLASRGIIDLDLPIAYWLPNLPEPHRKTTLRQLFTHMGGIRHYRAEDYDPDAPGGPITARNYANADEILALFIEDELVAPPGTTVSYSSFGYSLASIVLEAATGSSFPALVEEWISRPMGLRSLCTDDLAKTVPGRVEGYFTSQELDFLSLTMPAVEKFRGDGPFSKAPLGNPAFCWAGAGLLSNMPELAQFGAALFDARGSAITSKERDLLFTPLTEKTAASPPLGLGWRVDEDGQGRLRWHHAGGTVGGRASLVLYPGQQIAIAFASNTLATPGDVLGPSSELADLFS